MKPKTLGINLPAIPKATHTLTACERRATYASTMAALAESNPAAAETITQQTLRQLANRVAPRRREGVRSRLPMGALRSAAAFHR